MEELQRALGRVEGKLDALIAQTVITQREQSILDERVTSLEKRVWYAAGAAGAFAYILATLSRWWTPFHGS